MLRKKKKIQEKNLNYIIETVTIKNKQINIKVNRCS